MQIKQHAHMHKAPAGRVDTKKLLSDGNQPIALYNAETYLELGGTLS